MRAGKAAWRIRLAAAAEADFENILLWTEEKFGAKQARIYAKTLALALETLTAGPNATRAPRRDDIGKGVHTLHVARRGRKGHHFVAFRIGRDEHGDVIDVLRLLHDAMDLPRHVSANDEVT
jgi:toxin ParE1/3/4